MTDLCRCCVCRLFVYVRLFGKLSVPVIMSTVCEKLFSYIMTQPTSWQPVSRIKWRHITTWHYSYYDVLFVQQKRSLFHQEDHLISRISHSRDNKWMKRIRPEVNLQNLSHSDNKARKQEDPHWFWILTRWWLLSCSRPRIFSGLCEPTKACTVLVSQPKPITHDNQYGGYLFTLKSCRFITFLLISDRNNYKLSLKLC